MRRIKIVVTAVVLAVWATLSFLYHFLDAVAGDKPPKQRLTGTWPVRWLT